MRPCSLIKVNCNHSLHPAWHPQFLSSNNLRPDPTWRRAASTVALGTAYEHTVSRSLRRLGFSLVRVGKSNDCGIDLVGTWTLPSIQSSSAHSTSKTSKTVKIPVFVQCKNIVPTGRTMPSQMREVEGAFPALRRAFAVARADRAADGVANAMSRSEFLRREDGASSATEVTQDSEDDAASKEAPDPHGPESSAHEVGEVKGAIGVLATTRPATKGVREALGRSRMPLAYLQVLWGGNDAALDNTSRQSPEAETHEGLEVRRDEATRIAQMLWNAKANGPSVGEGALARCGVGVRYVDKLTAAKQSDFGDGAEKAQLINEVILQWQGQVWDPLDHE
ncbi:MAG: hypothetical protein Q9162_002267 [Coniocarpon cinnabarinum]